MGTQHPKSPCHTIILVNTRDTTFHPMPFRPSPRPSDIVEEGAWCRHKSIGHYTDGFGSLEQAIAAINENAQLVYADITMTWNGETSPHTTLDFPLI